MIHLPKGHSNNGGKAINKYKVTIPIDLNRKGMLKEKDSNGRKDVAELTS